MIWLTWRQHRSELAVAVLLLAAFATFALISGLPAHAAYTDNGVAGCLARPAEGCGAVISEFQDRYSSDSPFIALVLLLLPALAGMFVGAPLLAREFEEGTWELAWTQSVSRRRWLGFKLTLVGGGTALAAAAVSGLYTWWHAPFDRLTSRFEMTPFDLSVAAFTAYTVFAFAVGALAGSLIRRSIPAMAATLVAYFAVRIPIELWLRPRYRQPLTAVGGFTEGPVPEPAGGWLLSDGIADAGGRRMPDGDLTMAETGVDLEAYLREHDLRWWLDYHPAERFWQFQAIEAGIFVALATILLAVLVWQVRRHAT